MNSTQCDLSAGIAKIDFKAMESVLESQFFGGLELLKNDINRFRYNVADNRKENLSVFTSTGADSIQRKLDVLKKAADLLHTVYESGGRKVVVLNDAKIVS